MSAMIKNNNIFEEKGAQVHNPPSGKILFQKAEENILKWPTTLMSKKLPPPFTLTYPPSLPYKKSDIKYLPLSVKKT